MTDLTPEAEAYIAAVRSQAPATAQKLHRIPQFFILAEDGETIFNRVNRGTRARVGQPTKVSKDQNGGRFIQAFGTSLGYLHVREVLRRMPDRVPIPSDDRPKLPLPLPQLTDEEAHEATHPAATMTSRDMDTFGRNCGWASRW